MPVAFGYCCLGERVQELGAVANDSVVLLVGACVSQQNVQTPQHSCMTAANLQHVVHVLEQTQLKSSCIADNTHIVFSRMTVYVQSTSSYVRRNLRKINTKIHIDNVIMSGCFETK